MAIFNNYGFDCEVIVASIRHPLHLVEASKTGPRLSINRKIEKISLFGGEGQWVLMTNLEI